MKLSVKLLSGLTLMALIAVAVVGLSHSASAAADAKIYITNKASNLTDESSPPSGRTNASTVYGTYASAVTSGTSARDIVTDSDTFIVTVVDSDINTTETVTDNRGGSGFTWNTAGGSNIVNVNDQGTDGYNDLGDQFRIVLSDGSKPIVGTISDIKLVESATSNVITSLAVHEIFSAGDGTSAGIITVNVLANITTQYSGVLRVVYPTSQVNITTATVKSVVATTGSIVTLTETGRNTGRFEGYVKVMERTNTFTQGTPGGAVGSAATIAAVAGPITVTYNDVATSGTAANVKRSVNGILDVTPPTATISTPSSGSETQNRLPAFTGNVTDNQSGLDVSQFALYIDQSNDATNTTPVITAGSSLSAPTINGTVASIDTSGTSDGASSMAFSHTPSAAIPTLVGSNPDHVVDFQVRVADLAGNYGYSDSNASKGNIQNSGRHGNQPHTVKIDQVIPQISSAESGVGFDGETSADKANVRDTIKVIFDGNVKESSVSASDFKVTLSGAGGVFVPASVTVNGANVYLDLDSTIPSDNKPTVALQGTIQDLAGNSTDAGSAVASDKLAPVITVTRSGGSGTGTGAEGSDSLTNGDMTISVASDENLQGPPAVTVSDLTVTTGNVENGTPLVAQGGNTWSLIVGKSPAVNGSRAVKVVATDSAGNSATVGNDTDKAYTLDTTVATATSTPANGGSTTQSNPFITTDFSGDQSSLSVTEATLDGVDVTSSIIASADSKKFFFQPTTALTNAEHTYVLKVKDAAGNTSTTTTKFTKKDRTDFVIELFAGWNAVSVPSNPLDNAVGSVFSNTGVKQVVAYDATTPAQPWRIASKVDGSFSSQTTPGLTSVNAGPGYWVETSDFEDQKVALEGPTGPGDARPGLTTIPTGNGWNLVGVVDQSRSQTQSANKNATLTRPNASGTATNVTSSTYFNTVNNGRAYTFNTVASEFRALVSTDTVTVGSGIWVFISPQDNGKLPHIVP